MPRGNAGAASVAPPPSHEARIAEIADDIDRNLSYGRILAENGAWREPGKGLVHRLPFGAPYRRDGRWVQQTKVYPVAMSAAEARDKTRDTGERHDYYEPGARCKKCAEAGFDGLISGWVLGGRKFQAEHDHVTNFDPAVYGEIEVAPPAVDDDDPVAGEAPVLVEA